MAQEGSLWALGPGGIVYVTDSLNHKIRAIYPNQSVVTLAGGDATGSASGSANGAGSSALFSLPWGISADTSGVVYVTDKYNNKIRAIYPNQSVITLVGGGVTGIEMGFADGIGSGALFSGPTGVAVGLTGVVYVSDSNNNRIRAIYPNLTVTTFAGGPSSGFIDGTWATARFNQPYGVAVGNSGIVYVADFSNHKIRAIFPGNRSVITLAGGSLTGTMSGSVDGIGSGALFSQPFGVSVDFSGTVYVADNGNHKIRAIFANLTVVTLAGGSLSGVTSGSINGIGLGALFNLPLDVFVDPTGTLYVADSGSHKIRAISQDRTVTTFSGGGEALGGRLQGQFDGTGTGASFYLPHGTTVGPSGIVYVADLFNHKIRAIYLNQSVITLAGGNVTGSTAGFVNGIGSGALFNAPHSVQ
jgi:streptogramin lyase